jgi:hypothetical protein
VGVSGQSHSWKTVTLRAVGPGLLLALLVVAAYLRLRDLGYSPIKGDQSTLLSIAMGFVNTGKLPLAANKSSAGIMNPPLITYLLALPLFMKSSLAAVNLFQGIMGIAAVVVMAVYAQRLFGWRVALLATLLFAVNPWSVYYSRFIWNPNPIPLFSTLLLMSLLAYFAGKRHPAHLALSFLWLAAVSQLHLSGLVLAGVMGLILVLFWRHWRRTTWWRDLIPIAAGIGLAFLLYAPFFLFERAVDFMDLRATVTALTGGSALAAGVGVGEARVNPAVFLLVLELASGNNVWHALSIPLPTAAARRWLIAFASILFVASVLYALLSPVVWRLRRRLARNEAIRNTPPELPAQQTALVILAVWLLVPILLYVRHTVYLQNYYFLYLYPAPFLAIALMMDGLLRWVETREWRPLLSNSRRPVAGLLLVAPLLVLGLWQFHLFQTWFQRVERGALTPERQTRHVEQAITGARQVLADNPGCDLIILAEGETVEGISLGVMEQFVYPTPVRYVDMGRGYIIPSDCAVYMTVTDEAAATAWLMANGRVRSEQVQAAVETWRFYEISATRGLDTPLAVWQNGAALVSANIEGDLAPGGRLTLNYTWQVVAPPPAGARYHFFNHFLNESGELVAQDDSAAIDSLYWRTGDQLVTQFHVELPADLASGRYTLLLGMYSWPDLERAYLVDSDETTYLVAEMETGE